MHKFIFLLISLHETHESSGCNPPLLLSLGCYHFHCTSLSQINALVLAMRIS
ncbi:hypothetical protein Lalb_Chr12g0205131 [Lupinus albus]|uniref:Uncharacterized protein n=1 Tax=Lupinus albus TaxID=3870 RepID=A0A6A4PN74_LUPAL|nr:hypothetical protein Lalb_Chr12g0205131 [Lupinus albus]